MREIFQYGFRPVAGLMFDDDLNPNTQPEATLWNDQIITGLRESRVTAMVFPSRSRIGGAAGIDLIMAWAAAGHAVGNHTSGHRNLSSTKLTLDEFIADVVEADLAFRQIPRFVPMLRCPFLKEGNAVE
jgi:hypothetical protein